MTNSTRYAPPAARYPPRATRLLAPLALLALIALFFHKMVFSNLILARGDVFLYFYPYWSAAADALRAGRVPLWNPDLFMGVPLLANSQVGFFYPLNWPLWLLLPTPYAVSAAIVLHLAIAGLGAYLAGRRALGLGRMAGLVTAVAFALGGYLSAQVEHVNQLQGLAWLPWFMVVLDGRSASQNGRALLRRALGVAVLFALQLLAGHTQTTFITGVGVGVWILSGEWRVARSEWRGARGEWARGRGARRVGAWLVGRVGPVVVGGGLALLLAAMQLLPTLELAGLSSRQGGLPPNEALSFSLHPLLLARALLPAYGQGLFSEYTAVLPLTVLALAWFGGWQWRGRPEVRPALVLAGVGLFLALGAFNPLYWLLARLPGFDLFRAPARWLALYALGAALLAGAGWQTLAARPADWRRSLRAFLLAALLLMVWGLVGAFLVRWIPTGPEAPFELPGPLTVLGWLVEVGALLLAATQAARRRAARGPRLLLAGAALLVLFLATRTHPYNNLTTPEAYFDLRPPITRLQALATEPPARFLSLSGIFFDPGDQAEMDSIYADQLDAAARYDYTIAIKQKEIIAPNLPLIYGLAAVDGFDGGILPLSSYSQLVQLALPPGVTTTDGRLREQLTAVPEARWLNLFNAGYVITDKVGDAWRDGVFFDRQHPLDLATAPGWVGYLPDFEATELRLLATAAPGGVAVETVDGRSWRLTPTPRGAELYAVRFPEPARLRAITVAPCAPVSAGDCTLQALTLVDGRDGAFQPLALGNYRLIYSGDVKIYAKLDVQPRAFLVSDWQWRPDVAGSVAAMRAPDFDPRKTAVLIGAGEPPQTPQPDVDMTADIVAYAPEEVVVRTRSAVDALLVLSDANYPGWTATLDGRPQPLYQANGLFRGVFVPAGEHEVVFWYRSRWFEIGRFVSLGALVGLFLLAGFAFGRPFALD